MNPERAGGGSKRGGWKPLAVAGAASLAALFCGGCLYTLIPAMAGPSTTYPQPPSGQPADSSRPTADQNNQNNKPQSAAQPSPAPQSGAGADGAQ